MGSEISGESLDPLEPDQAISSPEIWLSKLEKNQLEKIQEIFLKVLSERPSQLVDSSDIFTQWAIVVNPYSEVLLANGALDENLIQESMQAVVLSHEIDDIVDNLKGDLFEDIYLVLSQLDQEEPAENRCFIRALFVILSKLGSEQVDYVQTYLESQPTLFDRNSLELLISLIPQFSVEPRQKYLFEGINVGEPIYGNFYYLDPEEVPAEFQISYKKLNLYAQSFLVLITGGAALSAGKNLVKNLNAEIESGYYYIADFERSYGEVKYVHIDDINTFIVVSDTNGDEIKKITKYQIGEAQLDSTRLAQQHVYLLSLLRDLVALPSATPSEILTELHNKAISSSALSDAEKEEIRMHVEGLQEYLLRLSLPSSRLDNKQDTAVIPVVSSVLGIFDIPWSSKLNWEEFNWEDMVVVDVVTGIPVHYSNSSGEDNSYYSLKVGSGGIEYKRTPEPYADRVITSQREFLTRLKLRIVHATSTCTIAIREHDWPTYNSQLRRAARLTEKLEQWLVGINLLLNNSPSGTMNMASFPRFLENEVNQVPVDGEYWTEKFKAELEENTRHWYTLKAEIEELKQLANHT